MPVGMGGQSGAFKGRSMWDGKYPGKLPYLHLFLNVRLYKDFVQEVKQGKDYPQQAKGIGDLC